MKTRPIPSLLLLALLSGYLIANAATCQKTGTVCVDTTPCKTISGTQVCLDGVTLPAGAITATGQTCWQYTDTYNCIKPNAVNYCQPFVDAAPACWQTSSVCAQMDTTFNTGCMQYTQTYQCGNSTMPTTPTNTVQLGNTYTLVSSNYNTTPCATAASNAGCTIASSTCTSTTPPALPPGISPSAVSPNGCYQMTNTYACSAGISTSDCGQYSSNPNCTPQSSTCINTLPNGTCAVNQQTFSCMTTPPQTTTTNNCSGQTFCQGGSCFNTGAPADNAFATAAALMEAGRQGGVYNQNGVIFTGEADSCRIRLFGLGNCCKSQPGTGYSNSAVMGFIIQAGGQALKYGSQYMYDSLYPSQPGMMQDGFNALLGAPSTASFQPSLSMYGFSATFTGVAANTAVDAASGSAAASAAGAASTAAASGAASGAAGSTASSAMFTSLSDTYSSISSAYSSANVSLGSVGGFQFQFNYYALALQVAIMVYQDLTSCNQNEQMLGMKRGQNLCTAVGSYCSSSISLLVGSMCVENTQSFCCYNSLLGKIINEQGRVQIGKSYGSPQSPNCSGFTTAEFAQIDFSKIDLSAFVSQIMSAVVPPNTGGITQNAGGVVQQKIKNYYSTGHQ